MKGDKEGFNINLKGGFNKMDETNNFEITFAQNVKQRLSDVKVFYLTIDYFKKLKKFDKINKYNIGNRRS